MMIFGWLVVGLMARSFPQIERCLLAYPLGYGLFTWLLFLGRLVGIPFTPRASSLLLTFLILILITITKVLRRSLFPPISISNLSHWWSSLAKNERISLVLLIIVCWLPLLPSWFWPVKDWDSIVLYDYRAKLFADTGSWDLGIERGYFFGYPLHTSLSHTWLRYWGMTHPALLHYGWFIVFIAWFWFKLRQQTSAFWASWWSMIIAISPGIFGHAQMTYTNLTYTVLIVMAYIYAAEWIVRPKQQSSIWLAAVLLGLSIWTRTAEPFWLVMLVLIWILLPVHRKLWHSLGASVLVFAMRYPWYAFEKYHLQIETSQLQQAPAYLIALQENLSLSLVKDLTTYVWRYIFQPDLLMFALLFVAAIYALRQKQLSVALVITFQVFLALGLALLGVAIFSVIYEDWSNIGGSAQRMVIFLSPLITYLAGLTSYSLSRKKTSR